uniref:Poly(A)-specific ribonuclease PNLDC1-like n=1 Tax=Petromyzon marinus TaxID=7757 RepID=A0AAJ7T766_PETMA|nr:poly(A)-specific ribonuclease PNLDC1-like [Petromyzon marinus]
MCDINIDNFFQKLPEMREAIFQADFIAIDTELSGLDAGPLSRFSLFDSPRDHYTRRRESALVYSIVQLGLSAFKQDNEVEGRFSVRTYNLYLCPAAVLGSGSSITWELPALIFLRRHGLDIAQVVRKGVPYLNWEQEKSLAREVESNPTALLSLEWGEEVWNAVTSWLSEAKPGDSTVLTETGVLPPGPSTRLLHWVLRSTFPSIWTSEKDGQLLLMRVTPSGREQQEASTPGDLCPLGLMRSMLGVTSVIRYLVEAQKPLVGHSMYLDLLHVFQSFIAPLPEPYGNFKRSLSELFPSVYDTKHMALASEKMLLRNDVCHMDSLENLYMAFKRMMPWKLYAPSMLHAPGFEKYRDGGKPHEAGYDAFMTGSVFLMMTYLSVMEGLCGRLQARPQLSDYLWAAQPFVNRVHMMRSYTAYMNLAGADPAARSSVMLVVSERRGGGGGGGDGVCARVAAAVRSSASCDVRPLGPRRALVCLTGLRGLRDVKSRLLDTGRFNVRRYRPWMDSRLASTLFWGSGLIMAMSLFLWLVPGPSKIQ